MKKLTIEHLAAYLPYKLLGKYKLSDVIELGNLKDEIRDKLLTTENVDFFLKYCKPILRNLSDLKKEIEINGEKFVPIDMFYEMYGGGNSSENQFKKDYYNNIIYTPFNSLSYETVQKLFEWHFDVFSLPENLWININKIQQ